MNVFRDVSQIFKRRLYAFVLQTQLDTDYKNSLVMVKMHIVIKVTIWYFSSFLKETKKQGNVHRNRFQESHKENNTL